MLLLLLTVHSASSDFSCFGYMNFLQENGDFNIQQQRKHNDHAFSLAGSGEWRASFFVNLIL